MCVAGVTHHRPSWTPRGPLAQAQGKGHRRDTLGLSSALGGGGPAAPASPPPLPSAWTPLLPHRPRPLLSEAARASAPFPVILAGAHSVAAPARHPVALPLPARSSPENALLRRVITPTVLEASEKLIGCVAAVAQVVGCHLCSERLQVGSLVGAHTEGYLFPSLHPLLLSMFSGED